MIDELFVLIAIIFLVIFIGVIWKSLIKHKSDEYFKFVNKNNTYFVVKCYVVVNIIVIFLQLIGPVEIEVNTNAMFILMILVYVLTWVVSLIKIWRENNEK